MIAWSALPLSLIVAALVVAALVVTTAGTWMATVADRLADRTGVGEAIAGGVFLGASTSLSGIVTSATAAAEGHADLAISNAVGGIAAQTFFLAVADLVYRRANLEHAAASATNLLQSTLLVTLLALPVMAKASPDLAVWSVHPATLLLLLGYAGGLRLLRQSRERPMWGPHRTAETRVDVPEEPSGGRAMAALLVRFGILAALIGASGYAIAESGFELAVRTGVSQTVVGALLTAVVTSLPELVTTIAAVRRGALTLAVGGVIGGNTFDTLLIATSDVAYRDGSIYHAVVGQQLYVIALTILLTGVLLMGLLRRETYGPANIGFESVLVLVLYVGAMAWLVVGGG